VFSHLIDRWHSFRILPPVYLPTIGAIAAVGVLTASVAVASIVLALAGAGLIGAQFCLNALAAAFYPTMIRATGVGWALGVGRLGAIMSPLIAGGILAAAWPTEGLFTSAAAPLVASCALGFIPPVFLDGGRRPSAAPAHPCAMKSDPTRERASGCRAR
jgi:AAHS family 4-hydroxybenzoate transporter-like MFS transporter